MKVSRHADIDRAPSVVLDAVARVHEAFIISPAVLSDDGRVFRVTITGGGRAPSIETVRVAPAGPDRSAVDVTEEQGVRGIFDRLFSSGSTRRSLEEAADELIERLRRGDLRPDPEEKARSEARVREMKAKMAEMEAKSPELAKMIANAERSVERTLERDPFTMTVEIFTLDGESRYKNQEVIRTPA